MASILADNLGETIQNENQPDGLPVITLAIQPRIVQDHLYSETVAERLLRS